MKSVSRREPDLAVETHWDLSDDQAQGRRLALLLFGPPQNSNNAPAVGEASEHTS